MTDPPFGGGGGGGGGDGDEGGGGGLLPAPGDLGFGLGDLDTSSLSHADRVQLECAFLQQTWAPPPGEADPAARFCPPFSDSVSCWPPSRVDSLAVISCFEELNGLKYDPTGNASRYCNADGTWEDKADYDCTALGPSDHHGASEGASEGHPSMHSGGNADYTEIVYVCGYTLSLVALLIACGMFLYFKETHCLRNKIHTNLFATYILSNFCWIITNATIYANPDHSGDGGDPSSGEGDGGGGEGGGGGGGVSPFCATIVLVRYFHLSTFLWMFVEGLYLFVQVIATFTMSVGWLKLRHYLCIGWGFPVVIVTMWASLIYATADKGANVVGEVAIQVANATANATSSSAQQPVSAFSKLFLGTGNLTVTAAGGQLHQELLVDNCPFMVTNNMEYIYVVPILLVLGLNTFFLVWIMWVVIKKLRFSSSTAPAAGDSDHQNWKAAKAMLVLIPLLGFTYLITIAGPTDKLSLAYYVFNHVRALLLSIQGFAVTLPYCFLNTEIKNVVRSRWARFQTARSSAAAIDRNARRSTRNSLQCYNYTQNNHTTVTELGNSRRSSALTNCRTTPTGSLGVGLHGLQPPPSPRPGSLASQSQISNRSSFTPEPPPPPPANQKSSETTFIEVTVPPPSASAVSRETAGGSSKKPPRTNGSVLAFKSLKEAPIAESPDADSAAESVPLFAGVVESNGGGVVKDADEEDNGHC